jgi:anti-anti-sigma regulatory factor
MLKIRRVDNGETVFVVCGRLDTVSLRELSALIAKESPACSVVLDLKDLDLVDRDAVEVLRSYTNSGIELRNCPRYVRIWMGI